MKIAISEMEENKERGNWSGKLDFLLSLIGYAVGLGNVWRFPYRTYMNGGATFLIPYVITLLMAGLPLLFLEMIIGQFSSLGPISVWRISPLFTGVGWTMVITSALCSIYYNMIVAYILYYLFASFTSTLPWQNCRPEWLQYGCRDRMSTNLSLLNGTDDSCRLNQQENFTTKSENCTIYKTPSEIYWERVVLNISDGLDDGAGDIKWDLALCLLLAWIFCTLCLIRGIKSSGKVVYFTAVFPYVVLIILLIWNVQLEGAELGIKFYLIPDWGRLGEAKVWYAAATQIFYSLGVAFGTLETLASYNKFHHNILRDSILVSFINCGTSFFAGFVIFSVIGHMAVKSGLSVDKVTAGGIGLTFVAYPEGLALMPVAPLWSILFFLMFFTLGIDSQFGMIEAVITGIVDAVPAMKVGHRKSYFIVVFSCAMFLLGIPQCARNGIYVVTLLDWYAVGLNLLVAAFFEVVAVVWIYGVKRLNDDIVMMIGKRPNYYWWACWIVLSPSVICFIIIFSIIQTAPASYGTYVFPVWADAIGWVVLSLTILPIPVIAVWYLARTTKGSAIQRLKQVIQHRADWGPALSQYRTGRYEHLDYKNGVSTVTTAGRVVPYTVSDKVITDPQPTFVKLNVSH